MEKISVSRKDDLRPGLSTPRMNREIALEGNDVVVLHSTSDGGGVSGWHHHGEHNVYGYLVSGSLRFEFGKGGKESATVNTGEYFHVAAGTIHRDVNRNKEEGQEAIIIHVGSGPMVVNVDGPEE